jgi:hypothetical protein
MPYIDRESRARLDPAIALLARALNANADPLSRAGETNYAITKLLLAVYPVRRYAMMLIARGILMDVHDEYYRRHVAPYEDEVCAERGDVY